LLFHNKLFTSSYKEGTARTEFLTDWTYPIRRIVLGPANNETDGINGEALKCADV